MPGAELTVAQPSVWEVACPGDWRPVGNMTEVWLRRYKSKHTRAAYWRDLRQWLAWCGRCNVSYRDARIAHADGWIEAQRVAGAADASIARRLSAVSSWYQYLIVNTRQDTWPLAVWNPAETSARPKVDPDYSPTIAMSQAEAGQLIAAADAAGLTEAVLIRVLLANGLRVGSVLDSRIENLGYEQGHRILTLALKGGKTTRVPLPPSTGHAIDQLLASRGQPGEGLLILTHAGRPMESKQAWRLLRKLAKAAGIASWDHLSPHSCRATAITVFLANGGQLDKAQAFAQHADPRTTQRYNKRRKDLTGHAAYTLADQFAAGPGTP